MDRATMRRLLPTAIGSLFILAGVLVIGLGDTADGWPLGAVVLTLLGAAVLSADVILTAVANRAAKAESKAADGPKEGR